MKNFHGFILAAAIEFHWAFVNHYRRKMAKLYQKGVSLSSPKMLRVNERASFHCMRITGLESLYAGVMGIA